MSGVGHIPVYTNPGGVAPVSPIDSIVFIDVLSC